MTCLLERAAALTVEFVAAPQILRPAEITKAGTERRVLLNFEREVEEALIACRHRVALKASGLVYKDALLDNICNVMYKREKSGRLLKILKISKKQIFRRLLEGQF